MENWKIWSVEEWWKQSVAQSIESDDALVTLFVKAFATANVVVAPNSDCARIERSISSLDKEQKRAALYEKENCFDILRHLSFGLIESLHILLVMKGNINGDQNQKLIIVEPNDESFERMRQAVEDWRKKSLEYSVKSNDALVTLFVQTFITTSVVLAKTANNARIERAIATLNDEREIALEHENNSNIIRKFAFGLIMALQVLLEKIGKINGDQNQILTDQALNSSSAIVELKEEPFDLTVQKEEPIDHTDQILEGTEVPFLFKEEEIDLELEPNDVNDIVENSSNELPSDDVDAKGNVAHSDVMGEQMNSVGDPIMDDHNRNSIPIEKDSLDNLSSTGENKKEVAKTEMMGEANVSIEQKDEKDKTTNDIPDARKDSSKTGEAEKRKRSSRKTSKFVNYTESLDELEEPLEKKPRTNSEKKKDEKRRSDSREKGVSAQTTLKCPNCAFHARSVSSWVHHLTQKHSTTPRKLGLALLCECGYESFSDGHSRKCDIAKFTVIRKSATPKCLMCETYPATARGYTDHLNKHHKTTLIKMGIFLMCSCGHKIRKLNSDTEHTKKCNGHEFTLHKVEDE